MEIPKPKLLIGIETLCAGGAESFVVLLANALSVTFEVSVFVVYGKRVDSRLLNRQKNRFKVIRCTPPFEYVLRKIDGLLFRLGLDYSVRSVFVMRSLRNLIKREKFSILHSNQFKVDLVFSKVNLEFGVAHVATIHGDYINFFRQMKEGKLRILNFERKAKSVLTSLGSIAYISDHQLKFIKSTMGLVGVEHKCVKIYNGIELPSVPLVPFGKNLSKTMFTFGMVARGIPDKGWETAIEAFLLLGLPNTSLVLVGESEYLSVLREKYKDSRIQFPGFAVNPYELIQYFDVGLLPTTFGSESLPTSVIEYLAMGKPSIASDLGEIRNMLIQNNRIAGILLPVEDGHLDVMKLVEAMKKFIVDKEFYALSAQNAIQNAKIFNLTDCSENYTRFYSSILNGL